MIASSLSSMPNPGRREGTSVWCGMTGTPKVSVSARPEFITWEQIARWAAEFCGSASEIVVEDKGVAPALITYDVSAIEQESGLKFDAAGYLREHLAYLTGLR